MRLQQARERTVFQEGTIWSRLKRTRSYDADSSLVGESSFQKGAGEIKRGHSQVGMMCHEKDSYLRPCKAGIDIVIEK